MSVAAREVVYRIKNREAHSFILLMSLPGSAGITTNEIIQTVAE